MKPPARDRAADRRFRNIVVRKTTVLVVWLCSVFAVAPVGAAEEQPCRIQVVLFTPADVTPPTEYQTRVDEVVGYAEAFFSRELKRWGHEEIRMPFSRTAEGHVEVTQLRGKKNADEYKPVEIRAEVMDFNRSRKKITDDRQVWWILVYAGTPPKTSFFLGGFGPEIGGWAVSTLDLTPGRIDPRAELGSDLLVDLKLKGMLHELGHGLRLPHIGPLRSDNAGNTLMGPTHANFRRVAPQREERVYLSEAEATMLSLHPAFQGIPDTVKPLPKLQVQNLKAVVDKNAAFVVTGKLVSKDRAVYALVADESEARPGEYWTKTYVGKVNPGGDFEVIVTEPAESNGTLKTWFVFENGEHTGDGRQRSRESGIATPYQYRNKRWTFP